MSVAFNAWCVIHDASVETAIYRVFAPWLARRNGKSHVLDAINRCLYRSVVDYAPSVESYGYSANTKRRYTILGKLRRG